MITINPARQLGLQDRLGSIEVGKDADISSFNAHPFDAFARCELALIDGEVWFQRPRRMRQARPAPAIMRRCRARAPGPRQGMSRSHVTRKRSTPWSARSIHPISGPDIANGTLIVSEGKIAAVGDANTEVLCDGPDDRPPGLRHLAGDGRRRNATRRLRGQQPSRNTGRRRLGSSSSLSFADQLGGSTPTAS